MEYNILSNYSEILWIQFFILWKKKRKETNSRCHQIECVWGQKKFINTKMYMKIKHTRKQTNRIRQLVTMIRWFFPLSHIFNWTFTNEEISTQHKERVKKEMIFVIQRNCHALSIFFVRICLCAILLIFWHFLFSLSQEMRKIK